MASLIMDNEPYVYKFLLARFVCVYISGLLARLSSSRLRLYGLAPRLPSSLVLFYEQYTLWWMDRSEVVSCRFVRRSQSASVFVQSFEYSLILMTSHIKTVFYYCIELSHSDSYMCGK